jgi:hypothetical protein
MKTLIVSRWPLVAAGIMGLWAAAATVRADDAVTNAPTESPAVTPAVPVVPSAAPQLAFGVDQIMELNQAQAGDSTILAYIKSSGNSYGLDAGQIIYLRQQGVSEAVITAMLSQPKPSAAPLVAGATSPPASYATPAPEGDYAQPPAPPVEVPGSSVYVIPDTATYNYCATYGYSQPYYAWPGGGPVVVNIGYGGRWGGAYRGGYRGGNRGGNRTGWHH